MSNFMVSCASYHFFRHITKFFEVCPKVFHNRFTVNAIFTTHTCSNHRHINQVLRAVWIACVVVEARRIENNHFDHLLRNANSMEFFQLPNSFLQHVVDFRGTRFSYCDCLKSTPQSSFHAKCLCIFFISRCTNDNCIIASQNGLQCIRQILFFSVRDSTSANNHVNLIDKQDNIVMFFHQFNEVLKPFFCLSSQSSSRNDVIHVQRKNDKIIKHFRASLINNVRSQLIHNGRFTNARFSHKDYIAFCFLHHVAPNFFTFSIPSKNFTIRIINKFIVQNCYTSCKRRRNIKFLFHVGSRFIVVLLEFRNISIPFSQKFHHSFR